jgi:hypothetical protein
MRALLTALACAFFAACSSMSTHEVPAAGRATPETLSIYVVKRGWHVDVGIATTDVLPVLQPVSAALPGSRYLLFGFGERRYLLHPDAGTMVGALWPGAALVMVTSLRMTQPQDAFGKDSVVRLQATPQQMSSLQSFIAQSLALHDGVPVPVVPAPVEGAYYESSQRYSAAHTCNTWAAQALQAAQLPIDSSGVEFAWQLWHQVQHLAATQALSLHEPAVPHHQRLASQCVRLAAGKKERRLSDVRDAGELLPSAGMRQ